MINFFLNMKDYPTSLFSLSTWSIFWLDESMGSFWAIFIFCTFLPEHSFMLKSYWWVGWGGVVVAHVIIVSAQSKELGFWFFRLRVRIWGLFEQGIGDLDSGLTTCSTWKPVGTGTRTRTWTRAWQFSFEVWRTTSMRLVFYYASSQN